MKNYICIIVGNDIYNTELKIKAFSFEKAYQYATEHLLKALQTQTIEQLRIEALFNTNYV